MLLRLKVRRGSEQGGDGAEGGVAWRWSSASGEGETSEGGEE